jgi:hypothetical protein
VLSLLITFTDPSQQADANKKRDEAMTTNLKTDPRMRRFPPKAARMRME